MKHFSLGLPAVFGSALLISTLWLTDQALAHAHLKSETPAANSAVASPQELTLKFSEGLEIKFTTLRLKGPDGKLVGVGTTTLIPNDNTTLVVPLTAPLKAGKYTVDWHAVSTDSHKTQGTYSFTIKP